MGDSLGVSGHKSLKRYMTTSYSLGRVYRPLPQGARLFKVPARLAAEQRSVLWGHHAPVLDQGQVGSCTGNATAQLINTDPFASARPNGYLTENDALKIYKLATTLDNVQGSYPPSDTGSTGIAAAEAGEKLGYFTDYTHVVDFADFTAALQSQPVIVGVNWYNDMFTPNGDGFVKPTGPLEGGHEFLALGVDYENQFITFLNSWGAGWGLSGRFKITFTDFTTLLASDGDATAPVAATVGPSPAPKPAPATPCGKAAAVRKIIFGK